MKNKMMKKVNKRLRKAKMKSNVLMEMAEDLKDLITNAKIYKQLKQSNIMPHSICANDISQKGCSNINMQNEELNKTLSKIFGG